MELGGLRIWNIIPYCCIALTWVYDCIIKKAWVVREEEEEEDQKEKENERLNSRIFNLPCFLNLRSMPNRCASFWLALMISVFLGTPKQTWSQGVGGFT